MSDQPLDWWEVVVSNNGDEYVAFEGPFAACSTFSETVSPPTGITVQKVIVRKHVTPVVERDGVVVEAD